MKFIGSFILLLASSACATQELNKETFTELTTSGKNGMIKFFQPWCGKKIQDEDTASSFNCTQISDSHLAIFLDQQVTVLV